MAASAVPLTSRWSVFSAPIPTFYPPARDIARAVFGDAPPAVASRLPPLTTSRPPMAPQTILPEERHPGSVRVADDRTRAGLSVLLCSTCCGRTGGRKEAPEHPPNVTQNPRVDQLDFGCLSNRIGNTVSPEAIGENRCDGVKSGLAPLPQGRPGAGTPEVHQRCGP